LKQLHEIGLQSSTTIISEKIKTLPLKSLQGQVRIILSNLLLNVPALR
jgi:hypothetical protein